MNIACFDMRWKIECACLQQERKRLHRSSEDASNDGSEEEVNEDDDGGDEDSGRSQVLQGSDASDNEVVDVATEEDSDDKDEVWMNEKRHSGDGEVC